MAAVLTSWKEIASYLGKGVRTVQRWEREMGLPVRRPRPKEKQIVLAFPDELEAWVRQQAVGSANAFMSSPSSRTTGLLSGATQLQVAQQPLRATHHEGIQRMHALLAELVHKAQIVHARTEDLIRNLQRSQRVTSKVNQAQAQRRPDVTPRA